MDISVIIPIYNEERQIISFQKTLEPLKNRCEIIFVDGGSTDRTLSFIDSSYKVLVSPKGRANQMNYGADQSNGDVLFFLHCDSEIPVTALEEIEEALSSNDAGCFGIRFHSRHPIMCICSFISNRRIKDRKIAFGDQGIFMKKELFYKAGKFPALPIMEDYQFSLTLREMGIKWKLTKNRIYTSDRRFIHSANGPLAVMWKMNRLRAAYRRGVPIEQISHMYKDIR